MYPFDNFYPQMADIVKKKLITRFYKTKETKTYFLLFENS